MEPATRRLAGTVGAIGGPALASILGRLADLTAVAAASLYMLAVVAGAVAGGLWSGIVAAIISFLALNFFFTQPRHTFTVGRPEELVALIVFLVVAAIVGGLVARALAERERAERREHDGILLTRFTTSLLSAEPLPSVLRRFVGMTVDRLSVSRCRLELDGIAPVEAAGSGTPDGEPVRLPVEAGEVRFGTMEVVPRAGSSLSDEDGRFVDAFVRQLGLALERSRLDAVARQARTEAEASRARAALFSSVTHDLRTPLASIKAGVTSLIDSWERHDDAQRRDLLQTMLEETDRLNRLVGNLLNLARARAGGLALDRELTPFEDVVEGSLARLRGELARFRFRARIRADLPAVWVDAIQLDQALTNVIENAARYSPPDEEIAISVAPWQGGVQVRVSDRGPGIPADERERVFEPFYRGRRHDPRSGTGLGLAIARAVVEAHHGRIRVEGTPGGGTTVVIELPPGHRPEPEGPEPEEATSG